MTGIGSVVWSVGEYNVCTIHKVRSESDSRKLVHEGVRLEGNSVNTRTTKPVSDAAEGT